KRFEIFEPRLFKPLTLMSGVWFKPMPDLNPVTERIVTVDRMAALFMPGNFRGIRSPVKLAPIEFFEDRRVELRCNAKVNVRPLDRARTALRHLIDFVQNDELPGVWHGERKLLVAGNLFLFRQAEGVAVPHSALL